MTRFPILTALLVGCWSGSQTDPKLSGSTDVLVELSAVTLGDDCGDSGRVAPAARRAPSTPASREASKYPWGEPASREASKSRGQPASMSRPAASDCAVTGCGSYPPCTQSSMQLSLSSSGAQPTPIRVKLVELLDANGNVLGKLAARAPTRWDEPSGYVTWDQTIAPNQMISASYSLEAPNWAKLVEGGQWNAHGKTFQLRVTLALGSADRVIDKQSITPAMLEPPVPT